jgi:hypothetical protein
MVAVIARLLASAVLPGIVQVLRGRIARGALLAVAYCACWQVLLVGVWLYPQQFPRWFLVAAACTAAAAWAGGMLWTALAMLRRADPAREQQIDRDLRTVVGLILQGAYDRGEQKLRAVLAADPECVAAWAHLGWLYQLSGSPRRGVRAYRRALWLDEEGRFEAEVRRELGRLRRRGTPEGAPGVAPTEGRG